MNAAAPLVSVILPVRNGGDYLAGAVHSILAQTLQSLELLLIDDGSDDGALQRLDGSDPRLRRLPSEGRGIVAALNTGWRHARGSYIARMDADDLSLPQRLQTQLDYLQTHPQVDIAGLQVEIIAAQPLKGGYLRYQQWLNALREPDDIRRELFIESPLPHPGFFLHSDCLRQLGGYADPPWAEDYDLLLRADAAGLGLGKPAGVLLHWRDHAQRLSRTAGRYANAQFIAAKAYYLARHRLHGRPVVLWGAGPTGRQFYDALNGQGVDIRAFLEVHPRRIGGHKRGVPVLHFEQAAAFSGAVILVAVGVPSARTEIREFLMAAGRVEGDDFLFVA